MAAMKINLMKVHMHCINVSVVQGSTKIVLKISVAQCGNQRLKYPIIYPT